MSISKSDYDADIKNYKSFIRKHSTELGYYVYALVDPISKQVFYIGKGQRMRMLSHVLESFSNKMNKNEEQIITEKIDRIQKIHTAGKKVEMFILHHGLTNEHAFIVESVLIDVFSNFKAIDMASFCDLTNAIHGYDHRRGLCSIDSLLKTIDANMKINILPGEKILAIRISGTETKDCEIYERVRKHWRLNPERANKATYIAACRNGVVIGLYKNNSGWLQLSNSDNPNNEGRFYFNGESVKDQSVLQRFLNRLVVIPKGARYPIMYIGEWS